MRDLIRELKESLVGGAPGLGVGFQAFPGPEPGKLRNVKVLSRYGLVDNPSERLYQMIRRLRSRKTAREWRREKRQTSVTF